MRLEEYDNKHPIIYELDDISSMKEALKKYTELIDSEEAFEDDYCVAHFVHPKKKIDIEYFKDHPELVKYLEESSYYYDKDDDCEDIGEGTTGETLFFLFAVTYPELEKDIKLACQSIANYSRKHNDSSEMWLTCEHPFGIEPLAITARKYPKYAYLLASFLIPHWDDEHMSEPLFALGDWVEDIGVTADSIKAFSYCDNSRARQNMLGYDTWDDGGSDDEIESSFDLLSHLRKSKLTYEEFTDIFASRYKESPFLQYNDDERHYIENPFIEIVSEILYTYHPYNTWDDDVDVDLQLTNTFIDCPADEAIIKIKKDVEVKLARPIHASKKEYINELAKNAADEKMASRSIRRSETDHWRELITSVFEDGDELWNYVIKGENSDLLANISETDIVKLAKENSCYLADKLKKASRYSRLYEEISMVMDAFVSERMSIDISHDKAIAKGNVLRLYDILHLAMGSPALHSETIELFEEEHEIASADELHIRYSTSWTNEVQSILLELNDYYSSNSNDGLLLDRLYKIIDQNRNEAIELSKEWFPIDKFVNEDEDYFLTKKSVVSIKTYLLFAAYIIYKDSNQNTYDEISKNASNFLNLNIDNFVMSCMSDSGKWPQYDEYHRIKGTVYDSDYQKRYQKGILDSYPLWKSIEDYLRSGLFEDYSYEESFEKALKHFSKNTDKDSDEIAENQPQYKWLSSSSDEVKILIKVAYYIANIESNEGFSDEISRSLKCIDILKRCLKLSINLAPLRVIDYLTPILEDIKSAENLNAFIDQLNDLKKLGLSNDANWIYQLLTLHKMIRRKHKIDHLHLNREPDYVKHYMKLMELFLDDIVLNINDTNILTLVIAELTNIQNHLYEGAKLIPRSELMSIVKSAKTVLGDKNIYTEKLDTLALDKLRRSLMNSLESLTNYIENVLDENKISYEKSHLSQHEFSKEELLYKLEEIGASIVDDERLMAIEKNMNSCMYKRIMVNNSAEITRILFGADVANYYYTMLKMDPTYELETFELYHISECPSAYVDHFVSLEKVDCEAFWMSELDAFINSERRFDQVEYILKFAISDYNYLDEGNYYDFELDHVILTISPMLRKKIIQITAAINPEKLNLVSDNRLDEYMDILFDLNLETDTMLKYLIYMEEDAYVKKYALKRDISESIKKQNIDDIIWLLEEVASLSPYHPLIIGLEKHRSVKVKTLVKELYKEYNIKQELPIAYSCVDYGVYTMGGEASDSDTENVSKVVNEPICIDQTTEIKASANMYIGLRFTSDNPKTAPAVCVHKVVVTHPIRNDAGKITKKKSKWDQTGYNNSNIFLGWFFDESAEILKGTYHFEAYDSDGVLMVEKTFKVSL